jgi:hypothetical protein
MLACLRRSRLLALVLILVAPGVTGTAVQSLHPCPVNTPTTSDHHDQSPAPSHGSHGETCQCIGSCHTAGLSLPGRTARLTISYTEYDRGVIEPFGCSFVPDGTPSHLLPLATAPPLS